MRERGLRAGLVAACFFPAPRGSQVLIDEMARAFSASGVETHLIAPGEGPRAARPYRTHGVRVPLMRTLPLWFSSLGRPVVDGELARRVVAIVREQRLEVLHAHNYEGLIAALVARRLTGAPVVYHSHNVLADELPLYAPRFLRAAARRFGRCCDLTFPRQADQVVALSSDVAAYLAECGVAGARLSIVPPAIDPRFFESHRAPLRKRRAVFAGNLDGYQNLELLLEAWRLVAREDRGVGLTLVTHLERRTLDRALSRCGRERIRLVRAERLDEVSKELGSAMVGVSPRASWSGFPIKTLNYMASATPTVAVAGSAKGVRSGETGWIVAHASARALADGLLDALSSPREAARRGRAALQTLREEHTWERVTPRLLEVSRRAIGEPALAAARARSLRVA